jgi:uncharacterized protein
MAEVLDKLKLDLDKSLKKLNTDYIDIFQLHNPKSWPFEKDHDEILLFLENAKKDGKIRHIGVTNHSIEIAEKTVLSGFFETLQFPFNMLCSSKDLKLVEICKEKDIGFIAMKALSGGLITDIECAFSFFIQFENAVPIWGIQRLEELNQFLELDKNPPVFNKEMKGKISQYKKELSGDFCRGCGYCLPCPAEIVINMSARMSLLLRRMPIKEFISEEWQEKMSRIKNCINCKACLSRCPYNLNVPELLKKNLLDYEEFILTNQ